KTNKVTLIFIPRKQEKQKTVNMHYRLFRLVKLFFALLLTLMIVSYAILIPQARKYVSYKEKIDVYHTQEAQLKQLLQDVNEMKQFNTYVRELIGMDISPQYGDYGELVKVAARAGEDAYLSTTPDLAPVRGIITKKFSGGPRQHYGIDIAGKTGDPVRASGAGLVVFSGWTPGLGNMVVISHADDYITVYGHNDRLVVRERQQVKKGDLIALMGETGYSTGPHLHFEIWHRGVALDPQKFIPEYKIKN
ncbi:MAG: M23 family metallopeptidase, partial [FCB group bacterium]|nr:M23 family metallopeptidase [FCB group bacterium]